MELVGSSAAIILLALWLLSHALILNVVRAEKILLTMVLCLLFLSVAYLVKPSTSDLPKYSIYFSTGLLSVHKYEVTDAGDIVLGKIDGSGKPFVQAFSSNKGFVALSRTLGTYLPKGPIWPRLSPVQERYISDAPVLAILLICLLFMISSCLMLVPVTYPGIDTVLKKTVVFSPLILGSTFFLLGSQNSLRQFLGTVFVLFCVACFKQKKYLFSIVGATIAVSMHQWMIVFLAFAFVVWLLLYSLEKWKPCDVIVCYRLDFIGPIIIGTGLGILAVVLIKAVFQGVGISIFEDFYYNLPYGPEIKHYGLMNLSLDPTRTSSTIKIIAIGSVLLLSEFVMGRSIDRPTFDIRSIRLLVFCFGLPLAVYHELFSRFLFFYFGLEVLYICWCIGSTHLRSRLAGILVFASYGIAPNCLNIMLGRGWIEVLRLGVF